MKISKKLLAIKKINDFLWVKTDGAQFQIYFLDKNIIRIRSTFKKEFDEELSYALVKTGWTDRADELLIDERIKVKPFSFKIIKSTNMYTISGPKYDLIIQCEPFAFRILNKSGQVLHEDLAKRSFMQDELGRTYHYSRMGDHNYFYGFGEKSGKLNKYKRRMRMHNTDSLGWDATQTDPLYKMIPFYIDFNSKSNIASGIFYNNAYDSVFDMDAEHSNYWKRYSYFQTDGGDIDFFFIGGPKISDVVAHYTDLTGKTAMAPEASLGYMGSTMYYTELDKNSDQAILNFADTCKKYHIPCDGFFLSSGYTSGEADGKRYVFNWNKKRFPNPDKFINEMKKRGMLVSPNIKPGMLLTNPADLDFLKNNAYLKKTDNTPAIDQFWGGDAYFVDFTSKTGRNQWRDHVVNTLLSKGITAIWNDNNEYELNSDQVYAHAEGMKLPINAVKPYMSTLMAKVARMAFHKFDSKMRPYVTNRAGFAGIQRYAQTWAGDNRTSWKNLKYNIPTILGMGLSGVANQGCDIGGFDGPAPEPELLVRWVQNGIFQPRFSIHSSNTDNTVTEPWMYKNYLPYISYAIKLRYKLIPYFYSLLREASLQGSPIMRPLVYEFQNDPNVYEESFEFMLGPSLLVANVLDKGIKSQEIYLPKGTKWFDLETNSYLEGGQTIKKAVTLSSIPLFLRAGAVLPESQGLTNIHNQTIKSLRLLIEPSVKTLFSLYEDDGVSNDYKNDGYLDTEIEVIPSADNISISFNKIGKYESKIENIELAVICPKVAPAQIIICGKKVRHYLNEEEFNKTKFGWFYDGQSRKVIIKYDNLSDKNYKVDLNYKVKDLISI